jgi:ribosomal protein S9
MAIFGGGKTEERTALRQEIRKSVHDHRDDAMKTRAEQHAARKNLDEVTRATRSALAQLQRLQRDQRRRERENGA